jgi:hypothetical protein
MSTAPNFWKKIPKNRTGILRDINSDHSPMIAHLAFSQFLEKNSRKEPRAAEIPGRMRGSTV